MLSMNDDILKGKWMQLRGEVKKQWGRITDDELDIVDGHMDKLAGILQERYGYTREQAEDEVYRFTNRFGRDSDTGMGHGDMENM